jgi:two-component sensor histidine kinase
MELEPICLPVDMAIPCGLILNELATNSLKHAFVGRQDGLIEITLTTVGHRSVQLVFRDNGHGFPPGLDWHAAESLGLRLVRMLSDQLRAELKHRNGAGTTFELCFEIQREELPISTTKGGFNGEGQHSHR